MATAKFYIIYINRKNDVTYEQVKEQMNLALQWYRVKEDLWIVSSTSDPEKWYSRLSPLVKEDGRVFICKLDESVRQGWMDQSFWDWLRENKS